MDNNANNITPENNNTNSGGSPEVFSMNEQTTENVEMPKAAVQQTLAQPVVTQNPVSQQTSPQNTETIPAQNNVVSQAVINETPPVNQNTINPAPLTNATIPVNQTTTVNATPNSGVNTTNTKKNSAVPLILVLLVVIGGFAYYFIGIKGVGKNLASEEVKVNELNDVTLSEYTCNGDVCKYNIKIDGKEEDFKFSAEYPELFQILSGYQDNITINIKYSNTNGDNSIISYEIFNKKTNEKIENIKNEEELRTAIGLHNVGTYTEMMTFISMKDEPGFGFKSTTGMADTAYTFYSSVFKDNNGYELDMSYVGDGSGTKPELVQNQNYNVTYRVEKEDFGYTYTITSIN